MMESRITTEEAIGLFIESRKFIGVTEKTIESYEWALKKMLTLYPQELPSARGDINDIFTANSHLSQESRKDLWSRLRTFWRWMEEENLAQNPMKNIATPRTGEKQPQALTDDAIDLLLDAAESDRDLAILSVLLDTGIRVGELTSLTRESIRQHGLAVKGKTGERMVPVSAGVMELLKRQGDHRGIWIGLRGRMTTSGLQNVVRRCMRRAGFDVPKIGPHSLRHTFGLQYIVNGGDPFSLQQILGHKNVKTTMIYVRMSNALVIGQHEKYSPMRNLTVPSPTEGKRRCARIIPT